MLRFVSSLILTVLAFVAPAMAQAEGPSAGGAIMQQVLLFLPLILIFYFLLIRPQQQRQKQHREMINNIRRGDTIITSGGLIGKVTKVKDDDTELTVELADNIRVRIVRSMIADVRGKGQLTAANDAKPG